MFFSVSFVSSGGRSRTSVRQSTDMSPTSYNNVFLIQSLPREDLSCRSRFIAWVFVSKVSVCIIFQGLNFMVYPFEDSLL